MKTFEKIYQIVAKIPQGKVLTYKKVAQLAGINNPRIVGFALHANKNPLNVPCHRVVNIKGQLAKGFAFGGPNAQKKKLTVEGIKFSRDNAVDLQISSFAI